MIKTWIADITPLYNEDCYDRYYMQVPGFRKEKADKMRFLNGRAQSIGAWSLLDHIRKEYGVSEKAAFNLSHSGDYVLCSVDMDCGEDTQLGCDVESVQEPNLKIAKRFFCPSEYELILGQKSKEELRDTFYRF